MLRSVNFYYQFCLMAVKINYIVSNNILSSEAVFCTA